MHMSVIFFQNLLQKEFTADFCNKTLFFSYESYISLMMLFFSKYITTINDIHVSQIRLKLEFVFVIEEQKSISRIQING